MDETTVERRSGGGFRAALAWIAILGLLAVVGWLVSERNARSWYLVSDEGRLVVMKGIMAPVGRRALDSSDPALSQAYAPIVPPPGKPLPGERAFAELSLLDQALYDLLAGWAREEIESGEPGRLERGLGYLARAEKLPGLSSSQRDDLAALRAESGYQEAIRLMAHAADELRDAAEKLRLASSSRSRHATDAAVLLGEVDPAVAAALQAVRAAGAAKAPPAAAKDAKPQAPEAQLQR